MYFRMNIEDILGPSVRRSQRARRNTDKSKAIQSEKHLKLVKKNTRRWGKLLPGVSRRRRMRLNKMAGLKRNKMSGLKRNSNRTGRSMSRRKHAREGLMSSRRMRSHPRSKSRSKSLSRVNEETGLENLMGKMGMKGGARRSRKRCY